MRYTILFGLFTVGFALVFLGITTRLGKNRWIYAGQSLPVFAQREVLHLGIPIGLNLIATGLIGIFPGVKDLLTYPLLFFFFATVVLAIWQPWWLKPAWLHWMENNYVSYLNTSFRV